MTFNVWFPIMLTVSSTSSTIFGGSRCSTSPGSVTQDLRLARLEDELLNRLERLGFGSQDEPRSPGCWIGQAARQHWPSKKGAKLKSAWSSLRDGSLRHVCKQITNIKSRKLSVAMFDHFCRSISCFYPPFLQATQFCLMRLFHTIHLPKELVFGGGISIERFAATASSSQGQFPRRRSPNR